MTFRSCRRLDTILGEFSQVQSRQNRNHTSCGFPIVHDDELCGAGLDRPLLDVDGDVGEQLGDEAGDEAAQPRHPERDTLGDALGDEGGQRAKAGAE